MTRPLLVAALDFVVDKQGRPWFIEANDRPMGMLVCDQFTEAMVAADEDAASPVISQNLVGVADLLASLGDRVVIASVEPLAEGIGVDAPEWLVWELREMDRLRELLVCRGVDCWTHRERGPDPEAVVYRRSFALPPGDYVRVVNSENAYVVTGSKVLAHRIVGDRVRQPRSILAGCSQADILVAIRQLRDLGVEIFVVKPDWGSLGLGVDVCYGVGQAEDVLSQRFKRRGPAWFDRFGPFVVQELIDGDVYVDSGDRGYLYDVRVYVVDRTVTGAVARRSAVPERFRHESSVAHVGAGGGLVPIVIVSDESRFDVDRWECGDLPRPVMMATDTWAEICEGAVAVCDLLSQAAVDGVRAVLPQGLDRPPGFDWYLELFSSISEVG